MKILVSRNILALFFFGLFNYTIHCQQIIFPSIQGWEKDGGVVSYTPDNLWDYINGAADFYLGFEFSEMHLQNYVDTGAFLTVEVYDQTDINHAYGIYSNERNSNATFITVGAEGYIDGKVLNFYQDKYYVKIQLAGDYKGSTHFLVDVSKTLSKGIGNEAQKPVELNYFPQQGAIPYSDVFTADGFLGYSFFINVFKMSYLYNETEACLFLMNNIDSIRANSLLSTYQKTIGVDEKPLSVNAVLSVDDPFNGTIYFYYCNHQLWGAYGNKLDMNLATSIFNLIGTSPI